MRYGPRTARVVVAGSLGLLVAACSADGQAGSRDTTSTVDTTASTTPVRQTVLDAYERGWDLYVQYGTEAKPFDDADFRTRFGRYFAGEEFAQLHDFFAAQRGLGRVRSGTVERAPQVTTLESERAVIVDCYDDRLEVWDIRTNTRVDKDDPRRHLVEAEFRLVDGGWKVVKATPRGMGCTP